MRSLYSPHPHGQTPKAVDKWDNSPCMGFLAWDNGVMEELSHRTPQTYTVLYCADCLVELPKHWKSNPKSFGNQVIELTLDNETNEVLRRDVISKVGIKKKYKVYRHGGRNKRKGFCHRAAYYEKNCPVSFVGDNGLEFVFDWDSTNELVGN